MAGVIRKFVFASALMWSAPIAILYGFNHKILPEQFRWASQASRRSFAEEDYLRRTGHHLGQEDYLRCTGPTRVREKGKKVTDIIQSKPFWKGVQNVLNVVEPLVRVLRAVDGERRSEMGYLYEAMDRANELIQMNNKTTYAKWWEIIDRRWEHILHHDLHAAGSSQLSSSSQTLLSGFLAVISVNLVIVLYILMALKEPSTSEPQPDPTFVADAKASISQSITTKNDDSVQNRDKVE